MLVAHLKQLDWILIGAALILVVVGLLSIYSLTHNTPSISLFKKQITFLLLGLFSMLVLSFIDFRLLNHSRIIFSLYILGLILLVGVLVLGSQIRGSLSWFRLGPLSLEPVELSKIAIILFLAKYFSFRHKEIAQFSHVLISGAYIALPIFLVLLQPDLGSVLIFLAIWIGIIMVGGIKMKHLILLFLIGILIFVLGWTFVFKDYQKERFLTLLYPERDPLGAGYNINQSIIAVGGGGIFGRGLGQGSQSQLKFLPESTTDFIFAATVEEIGFLRGVIFIFFLFGIIFWRIKLINQKVRNNFGKLLATGFSLFFISQILVNIGMGVGLFPITGLPLPFVSYGGSSLVSSFLVLGIIQSIKIHG